MIRIASINCFRQTGFDDSKQKQLEQFIISKNIDIAFLQEVNIDTETFDNCNFLTSNFYNLSNNNVSGYGTCAIIKNNFSAMNYRKDLDGRIQMFSVANLTFGNCYPQAGTDADARNNREHLLSQTLPNILASFPMDGLIVGDWNCISREADATNNPKVKISPSLKRLISTF